MSETRKRKKPKMAKRAKRSPKTTLERFLENPRQKKIFEEEHKEFLLSELVIALMEEDHISVRKLAEVAGVSPTIVQALRSGKKVNFTLETIATIAQALGCNTYLTFSKGNKEKTIQVGCYKKTKDVCI